MAGTAPRHTCRFAAPHLHVRPVSVTRGSEPGDYEIRWRLDNAGGEPASLLESWLPHSRFSGPRLSVQPPIELPAHRSRSIRRVVRLPAQPDLVVENAFLNLRIQHQGQTWRVLVRMRVERGAPDSVSVRVQAITAHRVGFAEPPAGEQ
jgi:hypothetical protein